MDIREQIEQVLEECVRPMLHSHGGEVRLVDVRDGNVLVELQGTCAGCPSADLSTKGFIKDTLKAAIPELNAVELEQTVSDELLNFARCILHNGG